ncbi:MAG TPA: CBS domain-containing protein [Gaiellaceae bacterium]|jgi:CBS domain-containing protein|nr:CBS domain-containing protein [Gaiellaceae bacterium]
MPLAPAPLVLHLGLVVGGELRDAAGERLGRLDDIIVRLEGEEYPPVRGVVATIAGRQVYVAPELIDEIAPGRTVLRGELLDLQHFRRRQGEVLLKKDVLDRQLINVDGARLVRANEIELARLDGWYRVVGVDIGMRGLVRRLVPRRLAGRIAAAGFLDWASVEPFTGHVPTVRLRVPHPKLARLHPAQLADLVEAASHREGEEIIAAVASDPELEADVFEELEESHQREFVEDRSDADVAELLSRMEADDAADLVLQLPEERREDVVALLPGAQARRVRTLLGYDPATAGGLMSPDFICLYADATREEALDRVRRSRVHADGAAWVYALNTHRRFRGGVQLVELLRTEDGTRLADIIRPLQTVSPAADLEEVARLMTDFDLTVVPVVGDDDVLLGIVTVDDVLELVLPEGWRRRFSVLGGD